MSTSSNGRKRKKEVQYIFRGKSKKASKSQIRKLVEAILMLVLGINLMIFLNTLPRNFALNTFLSSAWADFSIAFIQLLNATAKFGGVFIVSSLLLISVILVVGGIWRILSITSKINKAPRRRNDNTFK